MNQDNKERIVLVIEDVIQGQRETKATHLWFLPFFPYRGDQSANWKGAEQMLSVVWSTSPSKLQ